jgi:hypothetical protein
MVELLEIPIPDRHLSIYDPASGTGGMLSVAKEHLLERAETPAEKARVEKYVIVHGQELSPTNYAVCLADLLIKNDRQATVRLGNSLIPHDPHSRAAGRITPDRDFSCADPGSRTASFSQTDFTPRIHEAKKGGRMTWRWTVILRSLGSALPVASRTKSCIGGDFGRIPNFLNTQSGPCIGRSRLE